MALTRDSIGQFIEEGSWTARAKAVERIAAAYIDDALGDGERRTAEDVFRLALYDGEPLVRRVLAETLKHATALPSDIVFTLANDRAEVAAPFLAASPLLEDDDLAAIAAGGDGAQAAAIAERRPLSPRLAEILARHRDPRVLHCLLANEQAPLGERALHAILDRVGDPAAVYDAMSGRRALPGSIMSRLGASLRRRIEAIETGRPLRQPVISPA